MAASIAIDVPLRTPALIGSVGLFGGVRRAMVPDVARDLFMAWWSRTLVAVYVDLRLERRREERRAAQGRVVR